MKKLIVACMLLGVSCVVCAGTITDLANAAKTAQQAAAANPTDAALKSAADAAQKAAQKAISDAIKNKAVDPAAATEAQQAIKDLGNGVKKPLPTSTAATGSGTSSSPMNDDACKLYLCLMGSSEGDGGSDCTTRIQQYTAKFNGSCPDLPTCTGTSGPKTSGVLMVTAAANGGSTQGPENGQIIQVCAEEDTFFGTYCEIALTAPATSAFGFNEASCGGN